MVGALLHDVLKNDETMNEEFKCTFGKVVYKIFDSLNKPKLKCFAVKYEEEHRERRDSW